MNKIVINSSFAFVYLNKEIYSKEAIIQALNDFKEFITPSIKEFKNYTTLKIEPKTQNYSLKELSQEFINYLNGLQFQLGVNTK